MFIQWHSGLHRCVFGGRKRHSQSFCQERTFVDMFRIHPCLPRVFKHTCPPALLQGCAKKVTMALYLVCSLLSVLSSSRLFRMSQDPYKGSACPHSRPSGFRRPVGGGLVISILEVDCERLDIYTCVLCRDPGHHLSCCGCIHNA